MTARLASNRKFTRRGVILGAVGLAMILAVAGVAWSVLRGNSTPRVSVTLIGFEPSRDRSSFLAVFALTNETKLGFVLLDADDGESEVGFFYSQNGNTPSELGTFSGGGSMLFNRLDPRSARVANVHLPNDGHTGRVEVCLVALRQSPTGRLDRLREWWRSSVGPAQKMPQGICDQVIQCPLVRPDGTVQPPRLLSPSEAER